jgi:NDP-sugar pyrophosphorylase family protein
MQAIVLAGGRGTRLHPYTMVLPKPLMPIGDRPILEIIIRQLKRAGFAHIILAVGHMSHVFEALFRDNSSIGLRVTMAVEKEPLGTAGPIGLIIDRLEDNFLVMNGDLLTTLDYNKMMEFHLRNNADATIGVFPRDVHVDFGVIEVTDSLELERYIEKPTYHFNVSMGVNIFRKESISDLLKPGVHKDIPDLIVQMKDKGMRVCCYKEECLWLDIGRLSDYQEAATLFDSSPELFLGE